MDNKENSLNYLDDAVFDYYLTPTKKHKKTSTKVPRAISVPIRKFKDEKYEESPHLSKIKTEDYQKLKSKVKALKRSHEEQIKKYESVISLQKEEIQHLKQLIYKLEGEKQSIVQDNDLLLKILQNTKTKSKPSNFSTLM
jgi:hypothetical protein